MALLQEELENEFNQPLPRNAKRDEDQSAACALQEQARKHEHRKYLTAAWTQSMETTEMHALHSRAQTMAKLIAGHVASVIETDDVNRVTVAVNGNYFVCMRDEYPSEELVAQVMLAVDAGEPVDLRIADFDEDALRTFTPANQERVMDVFVMEELETLK